MTLTARLVARISGRMTETLPSTTLPGVTGEASLAERPGRRTAARDSG